MKTGPEKVIAPYSANCLQSLLSEQAIRQPDAIALLALDRPPLSYLSLYNHVMAVGRSLSTLGISGHDRVAIVLRNGPEMATAFLSVAAWVTSAPLNPAYRAGEFDFYLGDLNAKALIIEAGTDSPARDVARAWGISIIELSPLPDAAGLFTLTLPHAEKPTPPLLRPTPHDIALVLHTSGTTSRPKMVPLTHHNLICSARNVVTTLQLQPTECCLNVMPLFHIHGLVAALLASITAGGSVVCTPGFDANAFFRWIEMFRPSWYTAVPTIHQSVLAVAADQQAVLQQHPLRFLRTSSAAMPSTVMEQLEQVFQAPVIEAYGMTEASHQMTSNPLLSAPRKPRSVGIASQTAVAIADISTNQLLPQGAVGEVVICGESVTHGYANNPEANAKAFFDGWFRTGDQGYLDADGYLFLQGRLKEIVNRGGEKIAPLEVDEALMAFPEVHQAVAFAVPHPTLGEDLAAAVVLKPGANVTPEMLREYLFSHVADFKVPSQILLLDAIPKGATGKLQRLGLAKQLADKLQSGYVAPRNTTEQAIADIVAEVLGRERVGIEENFFTIGGDSLKGTQVASRLANRFGVNLPNVVVFPLVWWLKWGWHRVERAMERGKVSVDELLERSFNWCVDILPVEPVLMGEQQRTVHAIDSSTIARWRAKLGMDLLGKGYDRRAGKAIKGNIIAIMTIKLPKNSKPPRKSPMCRYQKRCRFVKPESQVVFFGNKS